MEVNSSSFSTSLHPLSFFSANTLNELEACLRTPLGTYSITAYAIVSILVLLPLYIFILHLGFQQWRQHRSCMTINHSEIFTYHMVGIELMGVLNFTLICCGVHTGCKTVIVMGLHIFHIYSSGQTSVHLLTCVERYLAVVHPIAYQRLRNKKGIRIRNIVIFYWWLFCIGGTFLNTADTKVAKIFFCSLTVSEFIVVCFLSLSVLKVLTRPGPGKEGRCRERVDQSKLRAFYAMLAVIVVLLFRFGGNLFTTAVYVVSQMEHRERCIVLGSILWTCLPSSLLLPLLSLHRAGKLACCKKKKESGR